MSFDLALAVEVSGNNKIGPVSATSAAQNSCGDCPFRDSGCYAESGLQGMYVTAKLNASAEGKTALETAKAEAKAIDELSGKRDLRLHVVGDCPTNQTAKIVSAAAMRHKAKRGKKAWTYTHSWRKVKRASWDTVSILASCENTADLAKARAMNYATALVVPEFKSDKLYVIDGEKILPCPEMTGKANSCADCKLCMKDDYLRENKISIGFAAHGGGKKKALIHLG